MKSDFGFAPAVRTTIRGTTRRSLLHYEMLFPFTRPSCFLSLASDLRALLYRLRQNAGTNSTSMANSSSRPNIISSVKSSFDGQLNAA